MPAVNSARESARWLALGTAACCLGAAVGCYQYAPVPVTDLTPDMTVRAELSAVAVDRLRRGPDSVAKLVDGFTVNGTVSQLRGDSVMLSVPTSYMEANVRLQTQLHDLALLRSDFARVQSRQLDKTRTTWTGIAIGVLGAAAVAYVLDHNSRSNGSTPKPPDPSDIRLLPTR
jgi:hypothetical protein